jgi:hypothetical protein
MHRKTLWIFLLLTLPLFLSSWGFFAHKRINRLSVFTLPQGMIRFYKSNINYITEHAVDPDKRRYVDSAEASRHYMDADHYGLSPFNNLPEKWKDAEAKFSADTLEAYGILPWQIERTYYKLVKAFEERDSSKILKLSSDIGHYIGDAHVPLHITENYNGQLSGQIGIHGFWESRLPELFSDDYDYFVGKARYIDNPLKEIWKIIKNTFTYKDSVLKVEARLSKKFPSDRKHSFSQRNGVVIKQYSEEYSRAYHEAMQGMIERQMRASIAQTGSFWYSAWVDAGQPLLNKMKKTRISDEEKKRVEKEEKLFQSGKIIGREE